MQMTQRPLGKSMVAVNLLSNTNTGILAPSQTTGTKQ